jgi:AraC-like DNA-binding protein
MIALDQAGAALPAARVTPPPPGLARWLSEGWSDRAAGPAWRIVADDSAYLIYAEVDTSAGIRTRLSVVGPRSRHLEIDRSRRRVTAALRLRPGALGPLFGVPAHELTDRGAAPSDLLGTRAADWEERVAQAPPEERIRVLCALLARRADGAPPPDWRVRALLAADRDSSTSARLHEPRGRFPTLAALCREFGLSPRTLRQTVRDEVGLAPSTVLKVRRLHRVLLDGLARTAVRARERSPDSRPDRSWAALAARHGYADQSHLIRDCRELLGETPQAFRRRADLFNRGKEQ